MRKSVHFADQQVNTEDHAQQRQDDGVSVCLCEYHAGAVMDFDEQTCPSDIWYQMNDLMHMKRKALVSAKEANKFGLGSVLANRYGKSDVDTQNALITWAINCSSRRGLERFVNSDYALKRSDMRRRTIKSVLRAQRKMKDEGILDSEYCIKVLSRLSEAFSQDSRAFALYMGIADEKAAAFHLKQEQNLQHLESLGTVCSTMVVVQTTILQSVDQQDSDSCVTPTEPTPMNIAVDDDKVDDETMAIENDVKTILKKLPQHHQQSHIQRTNNAVQLLDYTNRSISPHSTMSFPQRQHIHQVKSHGYGVITTTTTTTTTDCNSNCLAIPPKNLALSNNGIISCGGRMKCYSKMNNSTTPLVVAVHGGSGCSGSTELLHYC